MTTPRLTIEAIKYDGNNSSDILFWVKQNEKAYVNRKGRLFIQTIHGRKRVKEGHTVVRLGFDMFITIQHPITTY
jgi:hypothetical protein